MRADALVIGGGPAGSSAAIRLARSGRRVTLYEKARFPRPKLCGGFLSPEGLEDLEDLNVLGPLRQSGAVPLYRTVIASKRGTVIETVLPSEALSVSREMLDDLLLQEARHTGVVVHEGVYREVVPNERVVTIVATGRLAHIRHGLVPTPWYASPRTAYFGIQALFTDVEDVTDQVELDLVDSGYVGLARQKEGIHLCALTTQETILGEGPDLDGVLRHFMEENPVLRAHLKKARRIASWRTVGPVQLGIRRLVEQNTFYVGDAACVVDPFAGEGMAMGLYTSRLLVQALDQTTKNALEVYEDLWKKAFMPSLRWNAVLRMLYSFSLLREPSLWLLKGWPTGMNELTDLTRYRRITD